MNFIEVFDLRVSHGLFQVVQPLTSLVSVSAVVDSDLVHGEYDLEWIYQRSRVIQLFFFVALYKNSNQGVHILMSLVVLLLVAYIKCYAE